MSARLALIVEGCLLTVGNSGELKKTIQGKSRKKPTIINIPGGKLEKNESHRDAIIREMKEELGIMLDEKTLATAQLHTFNMQHIFELHVDFATFQSMLTSPSLTPWETNGVAFYNITKEMTSNNAVLKCETNNVFNEIVNRQLQELNRDNVHATNELMVVNADVEHVTYQDHHGTQKNPMLYYYWKDNNICTPFTPLNTMYLSTKKDKTCRNNRLNHELYRYLFAKYSQPACQSIPTLVDSI